MYTSKHPGKPYLQNLPSVTTMTSVSRKSRTSNIFEQTDPAVHMLGVSKSYRRLKLWICLALLAGCAVAILFVILVSWV
jgi:hypothetical protein